MAEGFSENVVIDEGLDRNTGIHTTLSFEGQDIIAKKSYDAEPLLEYAERARQSTQGQRWGDGRIIGTIPLVDYYAIRAKHQDPRERKKALMAYLQTNTRLQMFEKAFK